MGFNVSIKCQHVLVSETKSAGWKHNTLQDNDISRRGLFDIVALEVDSH